MSGNSTDIARDSVSILDNDSSFVRLDSLFTSFENDTIAFQEPISVSQIIYAEHKESPSVLYSIILPIIMLLLGVIMDRCAQIFVDKRRMKKNGKRWKYELLSCVKPIQKQIESFIEFQNSYCNDPVRYDIPDLPIYPFLSGKDFASLNKEDLYDYLESKMLKKRNNEKQTQDKFYKITTFVMSLEMIHKLFMDSYKSFKESSSNHIDAFNNVQVEYSLVLLLLSRSHDNHYNDLMQLYENAFTNHPNVNLFTLEESFISPSLSILNNLNNKLYNDLTDKLIKMRYYINGLKLEKEYIKCGIDSVTEQYRLCLSALDEIVNYF